MKRYSFNLTVLVLFFLIFYSNSSICSGEDLRVKIQERLQILKRRLLEEDVMLRILNEELTIEKQQLYEENVQLRQTLAESGEKRVSPILITSKEKMVYKADPEQQKEINKVKKEIKEMQQELQKKDKLVSSLEKKADVSFYENEGLQEKVKLTNKELFERDNALKKVKQEHDLLLQEQSKLLAEIISLKNEFKIKPKEKMVYRADPEQQKEIDKLKVEIFASEEHNRRTIVQLQQNLQANKEAVESLQEQLSATFQENEKLQALVTNADKELVEQNNTVQEAQQEQSRLRQEISSLIEELKIKPKEKIVYKSDPEQQKEIDSLRGKLSVLQTEKEELSQTFHTNEATLKSLQKQLAASEQEKEELQGEVVQNSEMVKQNLQLKQALKEAEEKQSQHRQEISSFKEELESKPREKIVYRTAAAPEREPKPQPELKSRINRLLTAREEKEEKADELQQVINDVDQWIKETLW